MNAALQDNDALVRFRVGPVWCCAPSRPVRAIIVPPTLTRPPGTSAAEPGIFRHGDVLVRVNDLRERFGVHAEDRRPGRLIVVNLGDHHTGFWVDEILDVSDFPGTGWGPLPPLLPRGIFSRTLNFAEHIHLFAEFSRLDGLRSNGYLRTWIASLEKDTAKTAAREQDSAAHTTPTATRTTPPAGTPDTPAVAPASPTGPTNTSPKTPDTGTAPQTARAAGPDSPAGQAVGRAASPAPGHTPAEPATGHARPTPARNPARSASPPAPAVTRRAPNPPASGTDATRPTPAASPASDAPSPTARAPCPAAPATEKTSAAPVVTRAPMNTPTREATTTTPPRAHTRPTSRPPSRPSPSPDTTPPPAAVATTRERDKDTGGGGLLLMILLGLFGALVGGIYWLTGEHGAPAPTRLVHAPPATPASGDLEPVQTPPSTPFDTVPVATEPRATPDTLAELAPERVPAPVPDTARPEPTPGATPGTPADDTEAEARPTPGVASAAASDRGDPATGTAPRATIERDTEGIVITVTGPLRLPTGDGQNETIPPRAATAEDTGGDSAGPANEGGAGMESVADTGADAGGQRATDPAPVRPATAPPGPPREIIHIVVRGDTLWAIAERYVQDPFRYPELARLSNIENPDLIYPGDRVRIRYRPAP